MTQSTRSKATSTTKPLSLQPAKAGRTHRHSSPPVFPFGEQRKLPFRCRHTFLATGPHRFVATTTALHRKSPFAIACIVKIRTVFIFEPQPSLTPLFTPRPFAALTTTTTTPHNRRAPSHPLTLALPSSLLLFFPSRPYIRQHHNFSSLFFNIIRFPFFPPPRTPHFLTSPFVATPLPSPTPPSPLCRNLFTSLPHPPLATEAIFF